jgi:hypothetical protein
MEKKHEERAEPPPKPKPSEEPWTPYFGSDSRSFDELMDPK